MSTNQYPIQVPDIVRSAKALARQLGFDLRPEGNKPGDTNGPSCCIDEVGSLLQMLCATITEGVVGEIGTGAGVGSAWMIAGLNPGVRFRTVETDPTLSEAVSKLFSDVGKLESEVEVVNEDWRQSFAEAAPYKLVFADGGGIGSNDENQWGSIAKLVEPGGIVVIDDLTPEKLWPGSWRGQPDPKRELAFNSGYFQSVEIRSRVDIATLLMVRK